MELWASLPAIAAEAEAYKTGGVQALLGGTKAAATRKERSLDGVDVADASGTCAQK